MIVLAAGSLVEALGWTGPLGWTGVAGDLSRAATGSLVTAVWQGILLAGAAGLGLRMIPKTPAAVRFAIWFAVFLAVTVLPVVSLPHAGGVAQAGAHGAWLMLDGRWSLGVAAVWMIASLVRAGTLVVAALQVRALWKRATPLELDASNLNVIPGDTAESDGDGHAWMDGIGQRRARLCTSDEVDRPTVIGFFSPKILIPGWLLGKLTPAELEQIVLHEAGHLGRADDWMNLLQKVALVVFPLNPALAWVERRLCFERELACDERVLHTTRAPRAYAAFLATLAEYRMGRRGLALALGALGRESELGRRVGRILRRGELMKPLQARLVLGGALVGLSVVAMVLERCPQVIGFAAPVGEVAAGTQGISRGLKPPYSQGPEMSGLKLGPISGTKAMFSEDGPAVSGLRARAISGTKAMLSEERPEMSGVRSGPIAETEAMFSVDGLAMTRLKSGAISETKATVRRDTRTGLSHANLALAKRPAVPYGVASDGGELNAVIRYPGTDLVQSVEVRSWEGADGSRMVLTMVSTSTKTYRSRGAADQSRPQSNLMSPYEAVPVRGGWLIFQL